MLHLLKLMILHKKKLKWRRKTKRKSEALARSQSTRYCRFCRFCCSMRIILSFEFLVGHSLVRRCTHRAGQRYSTTHRAIDDVKVFVFVSILTLSCIPIVSKPRILKIHNNNNNWSQFWQGRSIQGFSSVSAGAFYSCAYLHSPLSAHLRIRILK